MLSDGCKKVVVVLVLFVFLGFALESSAEVVKNCDGFVLLVDESSSMHGSYGEGAKIDLEKRVLSLINDSIPAADYSSALRAFSHDMEREKSFNSVLYYSPFRYDRFRMKSAISRIGATISWTSIGRGLDMARRDLKKMKGRLRIVVFSDGKENSSYMAPAVVAGKLKAEYGPKLCIYAVQVGDDEEGGSVLNSIVKAAGCGRIVSADDLSDKNKLHFFVKEVFGYRTAHAALRQAHGFGIVYFDFDKTEIKPQYESVIEDVVRFLKANPKITIEARGHTDSRGSEAYNEALSRRRAEVVKAFIVEKGIDPARIVVRALGEGFPLGDNSTEAGRAKNRRVDFVEIER